MELADVQLQVLQRQAAQVRYYLKLITLRKLIRPRKSSQTWAGLIHAL